MKRERRHCDTSGAQSHGVDVTSLEHCTSGVVCVNWALALLAARGTLADCTASWLNLTGLVRYHKEGTGTEGTGRSWKKKQETDCAPSRAQSRHHVRVWRWERMHLAAALGPCASNTRAGLVIRAGGLRACYPKRRQQSTLTNRPTPTHVGTIINSLSSPSRPTLRASSHLVSTQMYHAMLMKRRDAPNRKRSRYSQPYQACCTHQGRTTPAPDTHREDERPW